MMATYDNLLTQSPYDYYSPINNITTTAYSEISPALANSSSLSTTTTTATTGIDWTSAPTTEPRVSSNNSSRSGLLPWDVVADTFLKQLNGQGNFTSSNSSASGVGHGNGSVLSGGGSGGSTSSSVIQQLPFAAYQSVAAISTQPTGTDEQFHDDGGGGGGGGFGGLGLGSPGDSFVSWASSTATTPSQVFFIVKVVIMCFIIVAAVFGNLLVIVSVMRHRKLR